MADLRGGDRPDQPPDQSGKPDRSADRPRLPKPEPGTNQDPATIRRVMRASENPAFADPRYEPRANSRVETRYVTNVDAAAIRDPSKAIFFETSRDRPESKVDRPDKTEAKLDAPEDSKLGSIDKILREEIEDVHDGIEDGLNAVDSMLGRLRPTGQHVESPPDHDSIHNPYAHLPAHGSEPGTGVAAMLCTGLFLGEAARLTYRKVTEMREARHARNR